MLGHEADAAGAGLTMSASVIFDLRRGNGLKQEGPRGKRPVNEQIKARRSSPILRRRHLCDWQANQCRANVAKVNMLAGPSIGASRRRKHLWQSDS